MFRNEYNILGYMFTHWNAKPYNVVNKYQYLKYESVVVV